MENEKGKGELRFQRSDVRFQSQAVVVARRSVALLVSSIVTRLRDPHPLHEQRFKLLPSEEGQPFAGEILLTADS